jgi:hypothetical protein
MSVRNQNNSRHGVEFANYTGVEMKKARNVTLHKAGLKNEIVTGITSNQHDQDSSPWSKPQQSRSRT